MPTPSALASRLTRFVISSQENGSALDVSVHKVTDIGGGTSLVSWACDENPDLSSVSMEDIRSYLFFLENRHYSMICKDGSIVQMSFKIKRGNIVGHRLCFIPCPVEIDHSELEQNSLIDIVTRNIFSNDFDLVRQRGAIRFDFDPDAASPDHPAAHATINFDETRVPVGKVFDACAFLDFVDSRFLSRDAKFARFALPIARDSMADVLSNDHRAALHITWQ